MGTPSSWLDPQSDPQNSSQMGNGLPVDAPTPAGTTAGNGLSIDSLPASPSISSMMQPQTSASPQIPQNNPQTPMRGLNQQPADNFGGKLKNALQRFAYYGGQAAMKSVGLQTDDELNEQNARLDMVRQQTQNLRQQMSLTPVTLPNGTTAMLPQALAAKLFTAQTQNEGKLGVAQIGAGAKIQGAQIAADSRENVAQMNNANKVPSKIGLVMRANAGDPDAKKALDYMHNQDLDLMKARGSAFGQGRLWSLQRAMDPETGESGFYTGFDILKNQQQGKNLIPMGALSAKDLISVQQLTSEAVPAIQGVKENLGAFDNTNDRAIFARVMKGMGGPTRGNEASWMGNVLDQALKEGLSPQGQQLAIKEQRLAETMGRLRSTLGLPATDQSMSVTLGLLPGPSTPNSKYAGDQIKQLGEMVDQATKVPIFGGSGNAPMHGAKPSTGTATFTDGGTTYNIPGNQIADFMRDHPKAVKR